MYNTFSDHKVQMCQSFYVSIYFYPITIILTFFSEFTGFSLVANLTDGLIKQPMQKCGKKVDIVLLKINSDCKLHYLHSSGGGRRSLDNCDSVIQLCQTPEKCRPLFDGKTKANIIFRIESETSNSLCPKLVLQMDANRGWTAEGSTIYVSM